MSKSNAYKRQQMIKSCKSSLLQYAGSRMNQVDVFSEEFMEILRNRIFNSESEREHALESFIHLINYFKDLKNAVYVRYEGPSTFETIPLERSIARGMLHPFAKEFLNEDGIYPNWYLQSKVRSHKSTSS